MEKLKMESLAGNLPLSIVFNVTRKSNPYIYANKSSSFRVGNCFNYFIANLVMEVITESRIQHATSCKFNENFDDTIKENNNKIRHNL